jgi:hypothetical protein
MDYRIVEQSGRRIVELSASAFLKSEQDTVEIAGACGEADANLLLLSEGNLSSDFFDLRTGLAGAALLKWSNYRIRAAAVVSPERIGQGKFSEFALETNRGRQFFVASERESAEEWLTGG